MLSGHLCERGAHSVIGMFSVYFVYIVILLVAQFGYERRIWVKIVLVTGDCLLLCHEAIFLFVSSFLSTSLEEFMSFFIFLRLCISHRTLIFSLYIS